jgi:hypothetical protein
LIFYLSVTNIFSEQFNSGIRNNYNTSYNYLFPNWGKHYNERLKIHIEKAEIAFFGPIIYKIEGDLPYLPIVNGKVLNSSSTVTNWLIKTPKKRINN